MDNRGNIGVSIKEDICRSSQETKKRKKLRSRKRNFPKKKGNKSKKNIRTGDIDASSIVDYSDGTERLQ